MSESTEQPLTPEEARRLLTEAPEQGSGWVQPIGPCLKSAALFNPRPVDWFWYQNIPYGKLTVIGGNPGTGKTLLAEHLATVATTGRSWPDKSPGPTPGDAIYLSLEDDGADTLVPRVISMGGDLERFHVLEGIQDVDDEGRLYRRSPTLEKDVRHIEAALDQVADPRLLILDPISGLTGSTDSHKNAEVRGLLAPLAEMAARKNVAVVMITHLNKGSGDAIYRMMGSLAFVAAARTAWAVAADQEDPERRLFVPVKNNLGNDKQGFAYSVESVPEITAPNGTVLYDQPILQWEDDPIQVSANEALAPAEERSERDEAADWIKEQLATGPRPVKELQDEAKAAGLGWETLKKAKAKVGAKSTKRGFSGGWAWALPGQIDGEEGRPSPKGPRPSERTPSDSCTSSPKNRDLQGPVSPEECEGGQPRKGASLGSQEWEEDV